LLRSSHLVKFAQIAVRIGLEYLLDDCSVCVLEEKKFLYFTFTSAFWQTLSSTAT